MARWTDDMWLRLVEAEVNDAADDDRMDWLELPALGQLTMNRPELIRVFERHNRLHPEAAVRPFNFISVAYPKPFAINQAVRLVAPYTRDPRVALEIDWFDVLSGRIVRIAAHDLGGEVDPGLIPVKSFGDVLRDYAMKPESKFAGPDDRPCLRSTSGVLKRQRVVPMLLEAIGKESNMLSARAEGPGLSQESQPIYADQELLWRHVLPTLESRLGCSGIAASTGVSQRQIRRILAGQCQPRPTTTRRLMSLFDALTRAQTPDA